jgi:hypothetical protein
MEKNDIRCAHTLKQVFEVVELAEPAFPEREPAPPRFTEGEGSSSHS